MHEDGRLARPSLSAAIHVPGATRRPRLDRLGVLLAALVVGGLVAPFILFRANRIVSGTAISLWDALPGGPGWALVALLIALGLSATVRTDARLRLGLAFAGLVLLALALGSAADIATPAGDKLSRTAPAAGFWVMLLAMALYATDAVVRLKLAPLLRVGLLLLVVAALATALGTGLFAHLSVLREYANRADSFWREAATHLWLAFGSLGAALLVGIPLGIALHPRPRLRNPVVAVLGGLQTVPSIALFGLLIAPLAWVAANIPGAAALGIAGIGAAPALVALFIYSLLPMVANTLAGLDAVPPDVIEAARGMGMTRRERLLRVQLPLAVPTLLAAIRIVLVQNIGLATVAALIGGGGFGVFVFQGVGQTAMDLVLLGALPTIALAVIAAILLDAAVETVSGRART
jgi:osmoprotectant transport system permease protein